MSAALLDQLNHARLWQRSVSVWDRRVRASSLDRLLFLALHRAGWMGAEEVALLRRLVRTGMRVVDVGANVGLYSLLLAELVGESGRVFSFEPEARLCATLRDNCASNGISNVVSFEYAAGSTNERATFQRSIFNSGNNRLDHCLTSESACAVEVVRIDDILPIDDVDFIKIDVQGHELAALKGMERLLSSSADVCVFFEFWPSGLKRAGTSPDELVSFLQERGFTIFESENAEPKRICDLRKLMHSLGAGGYINLLASRSLAR